MLRTLGFIIAGAAVVVGLAGIAMLLVQNNNTPARAVTPSKAKEPPSTKETHTKMPVICLDPGHPSEVNSGTTVQNGLQEVQVVYDVALQLKELLEENGIARVVMTRHFRDYTGKIITNKRRADIANAAEAILFLRLHCDTGKGSGYALYYPDRPATKDGVTGPTEYVCQESAIAAERMHQGIASTITTAQGYALYDNGVKTDRATFVGSKQGALTGSIYSHVPTVTVEMVVLSNKGDAEFVRTNDGKALLAQALYQGIIEYLSAR